MIAEHYQLPSFPHVLITIHRSVTSIYDCLVELETEMEMVQGRYLDCCVVATVAEGMGWVLLLAPIVGLCMTTRQTHVDE